MTWVFVVLAALVVVAVALVAVGRETFTNRLRPRQAVFDLDEAVDFVADRLPFDVRAKLSYDDVRTLLGWHIEQLEAAGVSSERTPVPVADVVVITDAEARAELVARARREGLDVDVHDVAAVFAAERRYLEAIGAIGPESRDTGHT